MRAYILRTLAAILLIRHAVALSQRDELFQDYWSERKAILLLEKQQSYGGDLVLKCRELQANDVLMKHKSEEWRKGFEKPGEYPPSMHFFNGKAKMEQSKVFEIIRRMPKGALLHVHELAMVSLDALIELTYEPGLYMCNDTVAGLSFTFSKESPVSPCGVDWQSLNAARSKDQGGVDAFLRKALSLLEDDPAAAYPNIDVVWGRFADLFRIVVPIITYIPVLKNYLAKAMEELYDDGIRYVQVRTILPSVYDMEKTYDGEEFLKIFKAASDQFRANYTDFHGVKIIYGPARHASNETMAEYVRTFIHLAHAYPDFVVGFDLVGQEDKGNPLKDFVHHLLPLKDKYKFYFHAGETNWLGASTDENLLDAILLGTKRIGHGYALIKHPELRRLVRARGITVEVSPISNQVLKLVDDIRNHPAVVFERESVPMVITNDDPTFWDARAVSYDWYMAFMGMASEHSDLRLLKKLAMHSIGHCGLPREERMRLIAEWKADWKQFVHWLASDTI